MKLDVAERHVEFTIFIETMMKSSLLSISFHAITRHDFIKRWIVIIHFNDIAMITVILLRALRTGMSNWCLVAQKWKP